MKKTTKELNKTKLANYSAMAGAVLATGAVNAQITYVDVNPDAVVNGSNSPYNLDMNTDANPDVILNVMELVDYPVAFSGFSFTFNGFYAGVQAGVNAAVQGSITGSSSTFAPSMLLDGNDISNTQVFGSGGLLGVAGVAAFTYYMLPVTYPVAQGDWLGQTDKFLGVRFTNGANQHYGWVRMDVAADGSTITVKDYAYNSQPAGAIQAGQTVGLDDIAIDNKVTIKTQLDQAMINVTPDLIGGQIAMVDMSGRDAKVVTISDINTVIAFDGVDTGVYMLTARFENGSVSKKVYVK